MAAPPPPSDEVPVSGGEETAVDIPPESLTFGRRSYLCCKLYWEAFILAATPVLFSPFLFIWSGKEAKCGFVVCVMAVYWITECLPLPITSLLPVILFPSMGILSTGKTIVTYMNNTVMVFIGGLVMAIAIEHSNLHLRIALGVMKTIGCTHRRLLGSLCGVTMLISMWITNTAATAMMVPIISAVLMVLEKEGLGKMYDVDEPDPKKPEVEPEMHPTEITKAYFLAAAYCSSLGGTGTLVGTGTNMTLKGIFEEIFKHFEEGIDFTKWMLWAIPQMLISTVLTYFWLLIMYMGMFRPNSAAAEKATISADGIALMTQVIEQKYKDLGPVNWHEGSVAVLFVLCILLFIFRKPGFMTGWAELISNTDIKDAVPIIFITILMFIIPRRLDCLFGCSQDPTKRPTESGEGLITWKLIHTKMPWSLMFLLGGGFAISQGSKCSGLSKKMGEALSGVKAINSPVVVLFIVCLFASTLTEFTSNVGVANIILPVIAQMSIAIDLNPLYLMVPATVCCSYSFRLPVGTPPNGIIHETGHLTTKDIMIGGIGPSIWGFMMVVILFPTWGQVIYGDMTTVPDWANDTSTSDDKAGC